MLRQRDENKFKKHFTSMLRRHWDVQAIEDKYSSGIPDLNLCADGHEAWLELKVIKEFPTRSDTTLGGVLKHLTNDQINWSKRRINHGGKCYLLLKVMKPRQYILFWGDDMRELKDCNTQEAKNLAMDIWRNSINVIQLLEKLT